MKSTMTLEIDTDTLLHLIGQLKARGGKQDVSAVINDAIELWMREQSKLNMNGDPAHRTFHTAGRAARHHARPGLGLARAPQIPLRLEDVGFE